MPSQRLPLDWQLAQHFLQRLIREAAIEIGIIERLYTLDRAVTQALIEHGLDGIVRAYSTFPAMDAKQAPDFSSGRGAKDRRNTEYFKGFGDEAPGGRFTPIHGLQRH